MVTSVRLDPATERSLTKMSRVTGRTKSDLIRQAVQGLTAQVDRQLKGGPTAYDRLLDMIGIVDLGSGSRAARSEELLSKRFVARRS
ncbi:MAG: ribbon-helix-helix protein, CopG family [bacterium]